MCLIMVQSCVFSCVIEELCKDEAVGPTEEIVSGDRKKMIKGVRRIETDKVYISIIRNEGCAAALLISSPQGMNCEM